MTIETLKKIRDNFNNGVAVQDSNYVSLLAVEQVLKKKHDELKRKILEFREYVSSLIGEQCSIEVSGNRIILSYMGVS